MEELQQLEQLLKAHDWFYQYSEDPSKYRRGSEQRQRILQTVRDLNEKGLGEQANELFNQYKKS